MAEAMLAIYFVMCTFMTGISFGIAFLASVALLFIIGVVLVLAMDYCKKMLYIRVRCICKPTSVKRIKATLVTHYKLDVQTVTLAFHLLAAAKDKRKDIEESYIRNIDKIFRDFDSEILST